MIHKKGFSLIEVLISIAILSIIGVGILEILNTALKTLTLTDESETAKNIAEMQIEYVKSQPFALSYVPSDINASYPGYSATVETDIVASRDGDIQKLTATVRHGTRTILVLVGYKTH
jgi:prepilin-type N-terminal cleavage/methylation domain-containing protein